MSSKRPLDNTASTSSKKKQCSLTIAKKVELLRKHDQGTSVRNLCREYDIGKSTVYDLIKQKSEIFSFFADSDSPLEMAKRKTIRGASNSDHDKVMIEWFKQRRSENVPLTGPMIMAQAKKYHTEMGLTTLCDYTTGWLDKFKKRHGIRQVRICGEKTSADTEAADLFVNDFMDLVEKENFDLDQIYNADETALFWRYVPRKTLALASEKSPTGIKDSKERLTVLACANASGSHKLKLMMIGKSAKPRALKGVKTFPVIYKSNKRAWMTKEIFIDWFDNHFLPEVRSHLISTNLPCDKKVLLVIDNCTAHADAELLSKENATVLFLPPNCTSILQPMDNGILRALKCYYKNNFLHRMLETINAEKNILDFVKEFTVKDALWFAASAWRDVSAETLKNAWHNLFPKTLFMHDDDDDNNEFEGFRLTENMKTLELLAYAKEKNFDLGEDDIAEVMECDDEAPTLNKLSDTEIIDAVLDTKTASDEEEESSSDENALNENIATNDLISILGTAIKGLEQRNFISEQEILTVYKIREKLILHKPKMKQQSLLDMFK